MEYNTVLSQTTVFTNRPPSYARVDFDDETYFCPMLRIKQTGEGIEQRIRLTNWTPLVLQELFGTRFEDMLRRHSDPYWILDIGCGYEARTLRSICETDSSLRGVGIDILAQPGKKVKNLLVIQADVNYFAFSKKAKFDLIYSHQFMQHAYSGGLCEKKLKLYSTISDILKKDGSAFIDDYYSAVQIQAKGMEEELARLLDVTKMEIRQGIAADRIVPFIFIQK